MGQGLRTGQFESAASSDPAVGVPLNGASGGLVAFPEKAVILGATWGLCCQVRRHHRAAVVCSRFAFISPEVNDLG